MAGMNTQRLARISLMSALYAVSSFIPISIFLGAQSFLSASIIILPVISVTMVPYDALITSITGGLIVLILNPASNMFGIFTILLPLAGAVIGSLYYNKFQYSNIISLIFLLGISIFYLYTRPSFPYWVAPHLLASFIPLSRLLKMNLGNSLAQYSFLSTMCEQSMMLFLAISVLDLPVVVFQSAFLLMLYERTLATIGSTLLLIAIFRIYPDLK